MIKLSGFDEAILTAIVCFLVAFVFGFIAAIEGYTLAGDTYYDNKEACEAELKRTEHCINVYVKE